MIGIIGAMKMEVESLCRALTDQTQETVSGITFVRGRLYGKELVVAQSGVGKVFAAICAASRIIMWWLVSARACFSGSPNIPSRIIRSASAP